MQFATSSYKYVVSKNFALQERFKSIFSDGFEVDTIINNITLLDSNIKIETNNRAFHNPSFGQDLEFRRAFIRSEYNLKIAS